MNLKCDELLSNSAFNIKLRPYTMAGGPAYLLVPGLFGQYYPCYLWNVRQHFQQRGAEVRAYSHTPDAPLYTPNAPLMHPL